MLIEIRLTADAVSYCWRLFDGPDGIDEASGVCKSLLECIEQIKAARKSIAMYYCELSQPEPTANILEDGCVEVHIGSISGVVSSYHLVEPKLNQLRAAWRAENERTIGDFA